MSVDQVSKRALTSAESTAHPHPAQEPSMAPISPVIHTDQTLCWKGPSWRGATPGFTHFLPAALFAE